MPKGASFTPRSQAEIQQNEMRRQELQKRVAQAGSSGAYANQIGQTVKAPNIRAMVSGERPVSDKALPK